MVLGSTPGFKCRRAEAFRFAQLKEAVGMDQKSQRAARDDRLRPQKAVPLSNCAELATCKTLENLKSGMCSFAIKRGLTTYAIRSIEWPCADLAL
jgi:hypothetical protein